VLNKFFGKNQKHHQPTRPEKGFHQPKKRRFLLGPKKYTNITLGQIVGPGPQTGPTLMLPIHTGQRVFLKAPDASHGQSARNSSGDIQHVRSAFYPRGTAGAEPTPRPAGEVQPVPSAPEGAPEVGAGVDPDGMSLTTRTDDRGSAFTITPGGSGRDVTVDDLQFFLDEVTTKRIREMLKTTTYVADTKAELELWDKILAGTARSDEKPGTEATAIIVKSEEGTITSSSSAGASSSSRSDAGGKPAVPATLAGFSAVVQEDLPHVPPVRDNQRRLSGKSIGSLVAGSYVGSGLSRTSQGRPSASSRHSGVYKENEHPSSGSTGSAGRQTWELRNGSQSSSSSSVSSQGWQRPGAWTGPQSYRAGSKRPFEKRDDSSQDHGWRKFQKSGDGRTRLLSSKSQQGPRLHFNSAPASGKDEAIEDDSDGDDSGEEYDSGLDSDD